MSTTSQAQGAQFEKVLQELLNRVIKTDLGLQLLQSSLQTSGFQYGKDIQLRWLDEDGTESSWHIECKSHGEGSLHQREVADKLIDVYRSAHHIQVWCLALAHIEPGAWIDETFAWINEHVHLPFALAVLSPRRGFIKDLFACHKDLFQSLYPGEVVPQLSPVDRQNRIDGFDQFLRAQTQTGRQKALKPHGEWQLVAASRLRALPNLLEQRLAYLRGLTPTCPWEAVIHDWAVPRSSAERPLLDLLQGAPPGFSFSCLVGAGGEGKSTLLRQIAWRVALTLPEWIVLWSDQQIGQRPAQFPINWLSGLADGSSVLICVDESRKIDDVTQGIHAHWDLASHRKRVFVLMTDRGHDWARSSTRWLLQRARARPDDHKHRLGSLGPDERRSLVDKLNENGLLHSKSVNEALRRLDVAAAATDGDVNKPYLLPTLMQLTDPADRGFESIIDSILSELARLPDRTSYRILMATAIAHGAGVGLHRAMAVQMAGSPDQLAVVLAVLDSEIQRQWQTRGVLTTSSTGDRYFVHHAVVADGITTVAFRSEEHRDSLLAVCEELPLTVLPSLDDNLRMPEELYESLDRIPRYLDDDLKLFQCAAQFLTSWFELDRRRFPTQHRLAETYLRWLQSDFKLPTVDMGTRQRLAQAAREAYEGSLETARRVLVSPTRPPWFDQYDLRSSEVKSYLGWATLEDTYATHVAETAHRQTYVLRAIQLTLLGTHPSDRRNHALVTGTLALQLIHLEDHHRAAQVTAASIALGNAAHIVSNQRRMLREVGVEVPEGGSELLDGVFSYLCVGPLLKDWQRIGIFGSKPEAIKRLKQFLSEAIAWTGSSKAMKEALSDLHSQDQGV